MMMWWWELWPWPWPSLWFGLLMIIVAMLLCAGMMFLMMHVIEMMDHRQHPDPQQLEPSG
jgi:hypothetical protein